MTPACESCGVPADWEGWREVPGNPPSLEPVYLCLPDADRLGYPNVRSIHNTGVSVSSKTTSVEDESTEQGGENDMVKVPEVQNYADLKGGQPYPATLVRIEERAEGNYGPSLTWRFKVRNGKKVYDVSGITNQKEGDQKLARWAEASGFRPGTELPTGKDLSTDVQVLILKKTNQKAQERTVVGEVYPAVQR